MTQISDGQGRTLDWRVFDDWALPLAEDEPLPNWNVFDDMLSACNSVLQVFHTDLDKLLVEWDHLLLAEFGGDPTRQDWRNFRPLRLSREEDWSDWLAYLIERSEAGVFSHCLFGDSMMRSAYTRPRVEREKMVDEYRADIIVRWSNNTFAHVEVKIGDRDLSKTFPTSKAMMDNQPQAGWANYILLLSWQIPEWEEVKEKAAQDEQGEPPVKVLTLTWEDVCVALRRGLRSNENIQWKAFAYNMVGAIEQLLIEYPGHMHGQSPIENTVEAKIQILRKGLKNE